MKRHFLFPLVAMIFSFTACTKDNVSPARTNTPQTTVPTEVKGAWMYGNFSMTEYFDQNPANYIGNAFEMAIAFKFEDDGKFTQYFTSRTVLGGVSTYQQSLSKGTVEIDEAGKTIKTYTLSAHYKRTRLSQVLEERDLEKSELSAPTTYRYVAGTETNRTKALYLTLANTSNPITFFKK